MMPRVASIRAPWGFIALLRESAYPLPAQRARRWAIEKGLLPPIKIVNPPAGRPETRIHARFAGIGTLAGYTLVPSGICRAAR